MKILVLSSTFPRWKNDTEPPFVFLLSKHLSRKHKITVIAPHFPKAKFYEEIDGMEIYRFPYFFPLNLQKLCYEGGIMGNIKKNFLARIQVPFFLLMELIYTSYLSFKISPDIIHAHWIVPQGLVASFVRKLMRIPLVISVHGSDVFIFKKNILRNLLLFATYCADIVTVNSSASLKALESIDNKSKKQIIPMGIDISNFSPLRKDEYLKKSLNIQGLFLLAVGRIVEVKGFKYIIESIPEIIKRHGDAKLVIIGNGPEKNNLESLARNLGLENSVIFLGETQNTELPKYYASADIFIGPSIQTKDGTTEAFGIVFLEALASGVPVITTGVGGIGDIIQNEINGIVIPQKESSAIESAVEKIHTDKNLKSKIIHNGFVTVREKFSWNQIAEQFSVLYSNLTNSNEKK